MAAVYVLHFDPAFEHARHYVGFTEHEDVAERIEEHLAGKGSPLVKAAMLAGSAVHLAHVFVGGDRNFERRIKNRKDVGRWCRLCGRHDRKRPSILARASK